MFRTSTELLFTSPLHLQRVGKGLRPGALACLQSHDVFLDTLPKPILVQTKGAIRINRELLYILGLCTQSCSASIGNAPGTLCTYSAPTSLPNPPCTCSLYRARVYIKPLFQDWKRQLFYLIHRNEHRKPNKMKRQKNIPQMKKQENILGGVRGGTLRKKK